MHLFNPVCVNLVAGHSLSHITFLLFVYSTGSTASNKLSCVCVFVCVGSRGRYKALSILKVSLRMGLVLIVSGGCVCFVVC